MNLNPFRRRPALPVEQRALFTSDVPSWAAISGGVSYAGVQVNLPNAVGLPAVGRAIRLLSNTIAKLPLNVYRGRGADKLLADQTWQYRLLAEMPGLGDFTPFDLISDIVASLETHGNAFLLKVKAADQVVALIVIDPAKVRVRREDGVKQFLVRGDDRERTYDARTILHIRGFTLDGGDVGLSPIEVHRQKLGAILAQDRFHSTFYAQGTLTDAVVNYPEEITVESAQAIRQQWRERGGVENAGLPIVLGNGAAFTRTSLSLRDAQFVEGAQLNITDIANIYDVPAKFLTGEGDMTEQDFIALYELAAAPRLKRIEDALFIDADLFPQRVIYPEFDTRKFFRTDAATQAEVHHKEIQSGLRTVNEIRAELGLGPLPGGSVPQLTPVGGAPNPALQPVKEEEPVAAE